MADTRFQGEYTEDWPEIALACKEKHGWKCERCGHPHDPENSYVLTVHHLDGDKGNNADWNLACLCQRCHLHIQGKVFMPQLYMFDHSPWMIPHVVGYYQSLGIDVDLTTGSVIIVAKDKVNSGECQQSIPRVAGTG